jgi:2-octaprenyl-6-methoxyphenol hydroxylase
MTVGQASGRRLPIRVLGSGPVALAFAGFARRQGIAAEDIALESDAGPLPAGLASRTLALSHGSWQLVSRIALLPQAAPISTVDVTLSGLPGHVRISAAEMGVDALGQVTRYSDLMDALRQGLDRLDLQPNQPLATAHTQPAAVIVHAQGDCGPDASELRFAQQALIAEVQIEADAARVPGGTAFECFTPNGPLALLPVPRPGRYALVWCDLPERTRERAALDATQLAQQLQRAFGWRLGRITFVDEPQCVPMVRRARRELVCGNQVWIGNAAQALHPVAGQGLNLGLRDAFELAQCLGQARAQGLEPSQALQRYAGTRRLDRQGAILLTDTLARAFSVRALRPLQALALSSLDLFPAARRALAAHLMFGLR